MSNPFIQFELDAAKKAPLLASALGLQLREAVGGLALMWLHVYGEGKGDTVSPFFLRAFFGVDDKLAGLALVELGFLEPAGTDWRVKGAHRYRRVSEVRREAGRKGAATTNSKRSAIAAAKPQNGRQLPTSKDDPPKEEDPSKVVVQVSAIAAAKPPFAAANERQNHEKGRQKAALDPRSEILSPTERENLSDREPLPRSADAPPLEAGREPRQETSEGTRVDPPAPPPRPAPAPKPPPIVPPKTGRVRLWSREELPPSPPDSDFVGAVAWRLKLLSTRDAQRDEATVRTIATPMFEQLASDLEPLCPGEAGLMVLCDLDDYLADGALMPVDAVEGWIRARVFAMVRGGEMAEVIDDEESASASIH